MMMGILRALILFIQTLALYKSFTYLLTYLLFVTVKATVQAYSPGLAKVGT